MDNFGSQKLPSRRTNNVIKLLDKTSIIKLAISSLLAYVVLVLFFSGIEVVAQLKGCYMLEYIDKTPVENFLDIFYFNFVTILTVGYGDIIPIGFGRLISIFEAIFGVAAFTTLIALITTKMLLPSKNTIVFSKYAYYCTDDKHFLIIYLNTSHSNLVNAETSSYFKLGGNWKVISPITSPFITQSVQTFFIKYLTINKLCKKLREWDCLRVGIAGDIGFTRFSTSMEYSANRILVIPNRDVLVNYEGFHDPDLSSSELSQMFNYKPNVPTLEEYIKDRRISET